MNPPGARSTPAFVEIPGDFLRSIATDNDRIPQLYFCGNTLSSKIFWLRLRLPFALNHVNVWLCDDGDGWTIVDTGYGDAPTRAVWEAALAGLLDGRPLHRVLVTHFHPDHFGQAGWLCERTGAELCMSRTEWLAARALAFDVSEASVRQTERCYWRAALPEEVVSTNCRVIYRIDEEPTTRAHLLVHPEDLIWPGAELPVTSPVGAALIGLSVGDRMPYTESDGSRHEVSVEGIGLRFLDDGLIPARARVESRLHAGMLFADPQARAGKISH